MPRGLGHEPRLMTAGLSARPDPAIASSLPTCLSRRSTGPRREITAGSRILAFPDFAHYVTGWPRDGDLGVSVGRENLARRLYLDEGYRVVPGQCQRSGI